MSTATDEANPRVHGKYPARFKFFAADGIEITPDMIGRKVEFQDHEGYQGSQTLKGIGTIHSINYEYGMVTVAMPFKRNVYGRGGYNVGCDEFLTMHGEFEFAKPGKPEGRYFHCEKHGYQFDYPTTWRKIFRILPE